jgi:glucosamine--fructose-6-phosphate aminotransferase (isomerizing)
MCGIVAATANRNVVPILIDGLKALEYRGYDSAGLAVIEHGALRRLRTRGKVYDLRALHSTHAVTGWTGIAHTRWATHGKPSEANAHPHQSHDVVAVVHNGIVENHARLRAELEADGYRFESETDTEVIVHLVHRALVRGGSSGHAAIGAGASFRRAVIEASQSLHGAYAIAVIGAHLPGHVVGVRRGSPLVVGIGDGEHFLGSDAQALIALTRRFIYLEEGDFVEITPAGLEIFDARERIVQRPVRESELSVDALSLGSHKHYMLKEIHEQPSAVARTLAARVHDGRILPDIFGVDSESVFARVRQVHIVACGTSYHAGMVARHWIEALVGLPCSAEVASEYRYRDVVVPPGTLFLAISQSGETADTLAALRDVRSHGYLASLAICNVPESSLVREADLVLMTRAGPEIGVASTKAFNTQLCALAMLALELARINGFDPQRYKLLVGELSRLPHALAQALLLEKAVAELAQRLVDKRHALFLGRGTHYPVALEGALKLKEISYIHAEGYPAAELKHGPLALVDSELPVIAIAPDDALLGKLKSNLAEVRARGGPLFVFSGRNADLDDLQLRDACDGAVIRLDVTGDLIAPAAFTVPLQLLAYHAAVLRGTDVDQPRNLAKSVTVE